MWDYLIDMGVSNRQETRGNSTRTLCPYFHCIFPWITSSYRCKPESTDPNCIFAGRENLGIMKIVHVINCLDTGGAETMLLRLLSQCDRKRYQFEVISLTDLGEIADGLRALDVPVRALNLRRAAAIPDPRSVFRLAGWLRQSQPDLVQTWMYHANLVGGVAAKLAGSPPVIWGIRQTNVDLASVRLRTSLIAKGAVWLSKTIPEYILYNSHVSRRAHVAMGYNDDHAGVIANGFDLNVFKPDARASGAVRQELGLDDVAPLVGLIARYDPQKDHATFIAAAGLVHQQNPEAHFLLAGLRVDASNEVLTTAIAEAGLTNYCHRLGHRIDIPDLMAALDVACSSSIGEGFPNTVAEAMASGVPCVVTDVGDSALIVGNTGRVVPPRQPKALARETVSILSLTSDARRSLGQSARNRISMEFSLHAATAAYQKLWRRIAAIPVDSSNSIHTKN
jgi:glycosyltransferase involved in cell wall biosynthesis